ncbi:FCD domain-containing protein [uncultured Limosilactobacillus sp.]|uniref:FadR/GntR family transcriptional regulator n=1 Tax=uncultured Limosilactobacillus sp. TaxID=2837629 RepID=UPI0025F00019|nr:FCD domain-containing protein [uncultured Limosilactobacillus sp.]
MNKKQNLVEQTTQQLISFIQDNNIQVGEKLPNEATLSEQLQVSRSTLREAVSILISRNILKVRQGSGTYVSEKRGQSSDPFGLAFIKDKQKMISDLYDMRYILEPEIAALAAKHATADQVGRMRELVKQIEQSFDSGDQRHVSLDIELHTLISQASGNEAYSYIVPIISRSVSLFNKSYDDLAAKNFTRKIHREIIAGIAAHDQAAAHDTMLVHMANNRLVYRRLIGYH